MSHLAIYRKYRPSNFDEVSGQKIVVNILKNAIKNNNISHAYLFAGPRGTGKTSIAKIFARTINCENLNKYNLCNKCESCLNSSSKECVDIIEIDAASNNGVDEIRELKSKINIVPSYLKYKIYIIDEVHMLSIGAFNALLKTLEEPPSHVIFILATTELNKIPATILSRCQILEFKNISPSDIKNKIVEICEIEKITIEDEAINEIISFSSGCLRDALSLLEKISAYCNNKICLSDVRIVCGKPEKKEIINIIELLKNKNINECLEKINFLYQHDYDMIYIIEDIIAELEKLIFLNLNIDDCYIKILTEIIKIYDDMKKTSVDKKIVFEVGLLNYLLNENEQIISREIISRTKNEQKKIETVEINNDNEKKIESKKNELTDFAEFKNIRINNTFCDANKEFLQIIKQKWQELKKYTFDKSFGAKICVLLDGVPVVANENYVVLMYQYSSVADKVNMEYYELEQLIEELFSCKYYIVALNNDEWKKAKNEYISKINCGEKYKIQNDKYINNDNSDIINVNEQKDSNKTETEEKILELFDSEFVEIK